MQEDSKWKGRSTSYTLSEQLDDMTAVVENQWKKANVDFTPPVVISTQSLKERLQTAWKTGQEIAQRKTNKAKVKMFDEKLDKLVDITKCKCTIKTCAEFDCQGCQLGAHITCTCPREVKLPKLDLLFLKAQRDKVGEKGSMMIGDTVDKVEQRRKERQIARQEVEERRVEKRKEKEAEQIQAEAELREQFEEATLCEEVAVEEEQVFEDQVDKEDREMLEELGVIETKAESSLVSVEELLKKRNMVKLTGLASTAIRLVLE